LKGRENLPHGSQEEVEIRAFTIVAINEIRLQLLKLSKEEGEGRKVPNNVLLDFMLWDLAKEEESKGREKLEHHRTRSIYY